MSIIRSTLKQEFTLSYICFTYSKAQAFYLPQWKWSHPIFLVYRIALAIYTLVSFVNHYVAMTAHKMVLHNPMVYLTTWSYLLLVIHCFVAAAVTLFSYYQIFKVVREKNSGKTAALKRTSSLVSGRTGENGHIADGHIADAMNNCVNYSKTVDLPSMKSDIEFLNQDEENSLNNSTSSEPIAIKGGGSRDDSVKTGRGSSYGCSLPGEHQTNISWEVDVRGSKAKLVVRLDNNRWFMKMSWLLFDIASVSAIMVSCLYFITIFPESHSKGESVTFEDLNSHAINSLLVIIELAISAYPVRLLHVVYPFLFGMGYIIFNIIYWILDRKNNVLYVDVVDWNVPKKSLMLLAFLFLVLLPIQQLLYFLLYKLRLYIYFKIYKQEYDS